MPKGYAKSGVNTGRFQKTTIDVCKTCLMCNMSFIVPACRDKTAKFCSVECYHKSPKVKKVSTKIEMICEMCQTRYEVHPCRRTKTRFCSRSCQGAKIGKFNIGKARNKGIKRPDVSEYNKTHIRKREQHWGWNPNRNEQLEKLRIRTSSVYEQWRNEVMKKDNYICQFCGKRGGYLEVDHIKKFSHILKENNITSLEEAIMCVELWDIKNGRTLCRPCHILTFKEIDNFLSNEQSLILQKLNEK